MSTIIQFRAIDWGMEICELHVDLPESFGHGLLALYRVNSTIPLDTSSLSYNTRPPRIAKLGNIPLGNDIVTWHRKFSCAMDEVLSFELSCLPLMESGGDSDCFLDWVQIKDAIPGEPPRSGLSLDGTFGSDWRWSHPHGTAFNHLIGFALSCHGRPINDSTFNLGLIQGQR